MKFNPYWFLLCLLCLALSYGCRTTPSSPAPNTAVLSRERVNGRSGGTVSYRLAASPKTLNPLAAFDEPSLLTTYFLLNSRLVEFDHDTRRYVNNLAETWQLDADGRTTNIRLRDGLKFSDGHALTADDVAFTLQAIYDPRTAAPILRDAMTLDGAPVVTKVQDARNLQIIFPRPVASAENYLVNFPILPRHIIEPLLREGKLAQAWGLDAAPDSIVTAGPFVVASVTPGEQVTLKRNPHYWKKDTAGVALPYLEQLNLVTVADSNNALVRLREKGLDIFDRLPASAYAALHATPGGPAAAYDLGPGLSSDFFWFNLTPRKSQSDAVKFAWFQDARFRRAISYAIDRQTLAQTTLQGLATPLYGFVSPLNKDWAATDLPRTEYDLAKARQLLTEAGFVQTGDANTPELSDAHGQKVEFTLLVPAESEPRKLIATLVQQDLARLGIKMQIAPLDTPSLNQHWKESFDYDAALFGTVPTDLDPSAYRNFLLSNSESHYWSPRQSKPATPWEARLDELLEQQDRARDLTQRQAAFHEIQQIMNEQLPLIPVTARHTTTGAQTRLGNYRPSPIVPYSLWNADEWFIK